MIELPHDGVKSMIYVALMFKQIDSKNAHYNGLAQTQAMPATATKYCGSAIKDMANSTRRP